MSADVTKTRLLKDYPSDKVGAWEILGEDQNCDLGGPHSNPHLGSFVGKYGDAVDHAMKMSGFFTWGYGGYVRPTKLAAEGAVLSEEELKLIAELRSKKKAWTPKQAADYSSVEKLDAFNDLHAYALTAFEYARRTGRELKDVDHFAFERVMSLLGDDVFKAYNEYVR